MAPRKLISALPRPALAAAAAFALLALFCLGLPGLRRQLAPAVNSLPVLRALDFEEDAAQDRPRPSGGPGTFKKIVSAPARLVARLFRGKESGKDPDLGLKKSNAKQAGGFTTIPVTRVENGVGRQIEVSPPSSTDAALAAATTAERAAAASFDQGVEFREKGRLDAAIEKFIAAAALRPNYAEAYNLLAVCYDEQGQYRLAQAEYKKALKVEPTNARYLNNLGYSYFLVGQNGDAIKWYKKALRVTPDDRRLHNNLGLAYGRKGEYKQAFEHFTYAVGEVGAHLNLGYVYSQQGRYEEAIRHYEVALRAQPQSLPALSNLAQLYDRVGRVREAALLNEQYKKLSVSAQSAEQK